MRCRDRNPLIVHDDDGEPHELPYTWEICGDCAGHGRSSRHLGAFTAEQMREDPEFAEEYMAGGYDRCCEACGGTGKVRTLDREKARPDLLALFDAQQEEAACSRRIQRQEYLMEGGWREEGWYAS